MSLQSEPTLAELRRKTAEKQGAEQGALSEAPAPSLGSDEEAIKRASISEAIAAANDDTRGSGALGSHGVPTGKARGGMMPAFFGLVALILVGFAFLAMLG